MNGYGEMQVPARGAVPGKTRFVEVKTGRESSKIVPFDLAMLKEDDGNEIMAAACGSNLHCCARALGLEVARRKVSPELHHLTEVSC